MRNLTLAVLTLASLPSLAQVDVDVDGTDTSINVPGMQVQVKTRTGTAPAKPAPPLPPLQRGPQQPPPGSFGAEAFSVDCAPMNGVNAGTIKVVSPEGAVAQVWNEDGSLAGQYSVPFNFEGRGNTYYRFILSAPNGQGLLDKKLEAKQFIGCLVRLRGAAPPPPPPAAPVALGMPEGDFAALLEAVNEASFSEEKTGVIATAAKSFQFSTEQVGKLIDAMSFSADKLKALELTRSRIVDRQNTFKLLSHFTFSGDKEQAQKLLK
jgi:hypothetical protein